MTPARGRVLHCIPSMAGGGAEKQLALLAEALPAQGWDVEAAILSRGVHFERLERSGAGLHLLRSVSPYDPMIPLRLGSLIRRLRPDIVQTWLPQMDVAAGLTAWTHGVPWIVSERATQPLPAFSLRRRLRDAVTAHATAVISNSEEALRGWRTRCPAMSRFHVPNAVAADEIEAAPPADLSPYRVTPRSRIVLAAGRLVATKNMEALRAAMVLVTREIDAVAVICGIGPQRDVLLERAARDGLDERFHLPGFIPGIAGWMKAADAVVSVSHSEGRPNAVVEAMVCGVPLVVSDIPEHREIVDERSARLADPTDIHDVAEAILDVLQNREAAIERAAIAKTAAAAWTPDAIAAEYARIYERLSRRS